MSRYGHGRHGVQYVKGLVLPVQVHQLRAIDLEKLHFVGDALTCLRQEVDGKVC